MVFFFEKGILNITSSQLRSKHLLRGKLKIPYSYLRTWINIRAKCFIKTLANMKQKSMKVPGKRSAAQNSKDAVRIKLHRPKYTRFYLFYTLLFLSNLVFKFSILLIGFLWTTFSFKILLCSYFSPRMLTCYS